MTLNKEDFFQKVLDILEKMIDNRFRYLEEKKNENHYYANSILKQNYNPLKSELFETLKKELDNHEEIEYTSKTMGSEGDLNGRSSDSDARP